MIITLIVNFLVLSVICVGCDHLATRIIARKQLILTRTEVATTLCFTIGLMAFVTRGLVGVLEVSPLALIGPAYVDLTKTTASAINLKLLLTQIWESLKQMGQSISGTK